MPAATGSFKTTTSWAAAKCPAAPLAPGIEHALAHDAGIVITVPIIGYVAADKKGGGDVHKSGANYLETRFRRSEPRKGEAFTLTPDANAPVVYQDEFVNWVKSKFLQDHEDRPVFFALDNEPDLWAHTHKQVHPKNPTYAEIVKRTVEYASAIKDVTPKAQIFGPVNYGWQGYVRLQDAPDAAGRDFQEVYLKELAAAEKTAGKRLLDVLDVHWYPEAQGGGKRVSGPETGPEVVAARVQSPRSLWDANYTESSWITNNVLHAPIKLLPRLKDKIDKNYPGTKLAMTEYNFGGGDHISGAIAEADVLGIFGREGVFAACKWPLSGKEKFIAAGMRMFSDFDGKGGAFGDLSVSASTDNVADSSIYASVEKKEGRMVIVAINKTAHDLAASLRIEHGAAYKEAEAYQLTSAGVEAKEAGKIEVKDGQFDYTMPSFSVSTIRLTSGEGK